MADRSLMAVLGVNVSGFVAGMSVARQSALGFARDSTAAINKNRAAIDTVSTSVGRMAAVSAGGLGLAVKAAIDWETAWAGVTKTTSGTAKQMAELENQLREMAKTMPATHQEIAATAEAAGQLGVAREDIAGFTRVMVQLGETTNLTADEAATSIAQLTNIMGTSATEVDNLGATLVALGNNGASTERDIIQMAQRLAGAGKIAGATEGEILAMANALASVGIEAEAGGSSVSKILIDMTKAVRTGSADLQVWAKTAGMSVQQFSAAFRDSPAQAFDAFTQGLARINAEGGDVFTLLEDLGLSDIRVNRALLGMATSGDLLSKSLDLQGRAWKNNTALTAEYEKRNRTAGAEVQKSWNQIKDSLIDIGATALPLVKDLAQAVAGIAEAFGDLPEPVQSSAVRMAALVAVLGGITWAGMRTARTFADLAQSLNTLTRHGEALSRNQLFARGGAAVAGLGLAAIAPEAHKANEALGVLTDTAAGAALGFAVGGPWGAAIGGGIGALGGLIRALGDTGKANEQLAADVDALVATLDKQTGAVTRDTEAWVRNKLVKSGAVAAADKLGVPLRDVTDAAMGDTDARRRALLQARQSINAVEGSMDQAGVSPAVQAEALKPLEDAYKRLETAIGGTSEALRDAKTEFAESAEVAYAQAGAFGQVAQVLGELFGGAERYVGVLETVPKDVQTRVAAEGAQSSLADVNTLAEAYGKTPQQVMTALIANDLASGKLQVVDGQLQTLDGTVVTPAVAANIDEALRLAGRANTAINEGVRQRRPATIAVDAKKAIADAQRTKDLLESLRDRRLTVTLKTVFKSSGGTGGGGSSAIADRYYREHAEGGVVSYFAEGKENHVAQIAGAGAWRVWAEPETGGEAYIPLAKSKRARSLAIWEETGKRLGALDWSGAAFQTAADSFSTREMSVSPARMSSLSGGVSAGTTINITSNVQASEGMDTTQLAEVVTEKIMFKMSSAGARP